MMKPTSLIVALLTLITLGTPTTIAQSPITIPTPESVLGFRAGEDYKLATYDDALKYFRVLERASNHVKLGRNRAHVRRSSVVYGADFDSGQSQEHRTLPAKFPCGSRIPAGLSDEEARRLAREGKAFVHIDGGLHSTEVAGGQHTIQLAYDLAAGANDPNIHAMLDNVILMLWPSLNPDGQNMVAEWYRSNVGTPFETAALPSLYQKYVGHDNNRDAYMLNMIESRVVERTWRQWEPQITYVQHQTAPFPTRIWLPPFAEPIAAHVNPLMSRTVNAIGMLIAQALEEHGQPGATHMGTGYDAWYPGYVDYLPMLQNRAAFWTETALYRYATPHLYTLKDFPRDQGQSAPGVALSESVEGRMVAAARCRGIYADRVNRGV